MSVFIVTWAEAVCVFVSCHLFLCDLVGQVTWQRVPHLVRFSPLTIHKHLRDIHLAVTGSVWSILRGTVSRSFNNHLPVTAKLWKSFFIFASFPSVARFFDQNLNVFRSESRGIVHTKIHIRFNLIALLHLFWFAVARCCTRLFTLTDLCSVFYLILLAAFIRNSRSCLVSFSLPRSTSVCFCFIRLRTRCRRHTHTHTFSAFIFLRWFPIFASLPPCRCVIHHRLRLLSSSVDRSNDAFDCHALARFANPGLSLIYVLFCEKRSN